MIVHEGLIGAWNYTTGPAIIYESRATLDVISRAPDPFVLVVPETISLEDLFRVDIRHVRGFVLALAGTDDVLTTFLIKEKRAAVRGVTRILDGLANGDTVIVDGVNGKVFVKPDAETLARYAALREAGAPEIGVAHLPRLAREAMCGMPPLPPRTPFPKLAPMPEMLSKPSWGEGMPGGFPTPLEVRADLEKELDSIRDLLTNVDSMRAGFVQSAVLSRVELFVDRRFTPAEVEAVNRAVSDELLRLEQERKAAEPPPPELEEPEPRSGSRRRAVVAARPAVEIEAVTEPVTETEAAVPSPQPVAD